KWRRGKGWDWKQRTIDGDRRNHRIDTRAVKQARIHSRLAFIDSPPHGGHNLVDDSQEVSIVLEAQIDPVQLSVPLHEDDIMRIHENVRYRLIFHQWLERTKT